MKKKTVNRKLGAKRNKVFIFNEDGTFNHEFIAIVLKVGAKKPNAK